jgi:hypothetical protein
MPVATATTALPSGGQPASEALAGPADDWDCRNEACPEFGRAVRTEKPSGEEKPEPEGPRGAHP